MDQIKPKLSEAVANNNSIVLGYLLALQHKKITIATLAETPHGLSILKNIKTSSKSIIDELAYDYLNGIMNSKFKRTSTHFGDIFDLCFLPHRFENIRKLARIMWTQTDKTKIKQDLGLNGKSCPILEKSVDEIMKGEPFYNNEIALALHCFMETMMWCCSFHEINESTMEYNSSNVLSSIWSQAPRLILRTKDPNNRKLCDLMKDRGGNFAEVVRLTSTRYFSIDADTCYALNQIFRKYSSGYSDRITGMYHSYNVKEDFKAR